MIRRVFENLGWKALSLLLAVVLWFIVVGEPTLTTIISAPLEFRNIPPALEVSGEIPDNIRVELRGSSSLLEAADLASVAVILDLSPVLEPGLRTFTIDRRNVQLPSGVEFVRSIPSQLRIDFEQQVTREVPVEPKFSGRPQDGYRLTGVSVSPAQLKITGAGSRVNRVASVESDPIDLTGVIGSREFQVGAFVGDPQVRFESAPVVTVRVVVEKSLDAGAP